MPEIQPITPEYVERLESSIKELKDFQKSLPETKQKIWDLLKGAESVALSQDKAEKAATAAEKANKAIQDQQLTFQKSITQTSETLKGLNQQQSALQEKIKEIEDTYNLLMTLKSKLLTDETNDQGEITKPCAATEIRRLLKKIEAAYKEQADDFEKLYKERSDKINSLLPGAGAAGLASSYYEAKMKYTITNDLSSRDDDSGKKFRLSRRDFIPQYVAYGFNMSLFLVPLGFLVYIFWGHQVSTISAAQPSYADLLYRLTLTLPLAAISLYGISSLMTNRRLYEEYNHKQRVMQLYHSFKKEIDTSSDHDLKIKLLNVMLDVVQDKPASKLSRYEKTIFTAIQEQTGKISDKVLGKE